MRERLRGRIAAVLGALLLCPPGPACAAVWESRVTHVADGDTVTVLRRGRSETLRLLYIDAPESDQPHGREARRRLQQMVRGVRVKVDTRGKDRYGRTLARISRVPDGLDINFELVRTGMAWANARGAEARRYRAAEAAAREAGAGLWRDPAPVPPRTWRRTRR